MKIEFTRKTVKNLKKRLQLAKKWNNAGAVMKIAAILMLALEIPDEDVADIWGITVRTLYNFPGKRNEKFHCNQEKRLSCEID